MSKENKTPAKSNKPNLSQGKKENNAYKDAKENIENRSYKGRVL